MSTPTPTRPSQATLACWMVIGGSLFVVVSVYQRISTLRSIDSRKAFEEFLAEPPGSQLGISVSEMTDWVQLLCVVAGGTATAMTILGVYAMRGSAGARLALSILCVPLVLAGMATAGFLAPLVAAGVLMLWFQPTRDWFAGRAPRPDAAGSAGSAGSAGGRLAAEPERERPGPPHAAPPAAMPPSTGAPGGTGEGPRAVSGFGAPSATATQPAPASSAYGMVAPPRSGPQAPRPSTLTTACVVTLVTTAVVTVMLVLSGAGLLAGSDALIEDAIADARQQSPELADVEVGVGLVKGLLAAMIAVLAVLAGLAAAFAVAALRRRRWGHVGLLVCAILTAAGGGIFAVFGAWPLIVPAMAAVLVTALLLRPEVRTWVYPR